MAEPMDLSDVALAELGANLMWPPGRGGDIARALLAIRDAATAACILAVCEHCASGNQPFLVEGLWAHEFRGEFRGTTGRPGKWSSRGGCRAEPIRKLAALRGGDHE